MKTARTCSRYTNAWFRTSVLTSTRAKISTAFANCLAMLSIIYLPPSAQDGEELRSMQVGADVFGSMWQVGASRLAPNNTTVNAARQPTVSSAPLLLEIFLFFLRRRSEVQRNSLTLHTPVSSFGVLCIWLQLLLSCFLRRGYCAVVIREMTPYSASPTAKRHLFFVCCKPFKHSTNDVHCVHVHFLPGSRVCLLDI